MNRKLLAVTISSVLLLFTGCRDDASEETHVVDRKVGLGPAGFTLGDSAFFPLAVNYLVGPRWENGELWFGPSAEYRTDIADHFCTKEMALERLRGDLDMIREMGCNSIRLVGICNDQGSDDIKDSLGLKVALRADHDTVILFGEDKALTLYLKAMDELLELCEQAGLMAVPLTTIFLDAPANEQFLTRYLAHLNGTRSILAFDLFNEPLYFDRKERPKREAIRVVARWRELMDLHAPDHLFTIGLTGIRESFEFDPNEIDVDFISFHPYEYEPDQVRNELAWYGKELRVPWIIGETAIPADGDSVAYSEQVDFAMRTLHQARACGALGYSWWQYKDVRWNYFHADFMGLLAREGSSTTSSGHHVEGSPKPIAEVFRKFDPRDPKGECEVPTNFFNYSQHRGSRITGKLVTIGGDPIRQGVVIGWNEGWTTSYHTVTKDDGTFELLGDFRFCHWMATGLSFSVKRGDPGEVLFSKATDGVLTYELGTITLHGLGFIGRIHESLDRITEPMRDGRYRVGP